MSRPALICAFVAIAACGGTRSSKPATPDNKSTATEPAAPSQFAMDYCDSFRACAKERARMSMEVDDGGEPDPAVLAETVEASIEQCRTTTSGLSAGQETWLESCTGCGGSCDVYDCMDRVPPEAEPAPFECDMGGE